MQQLTFIHANSKKAWLEASVFVSEKENLWYLQWTFPLMLTMPRKGIGTLLILLPDKMPFTNLAS